MSAFEDDHAEAHPGWTAYLARVAAALGGTVDDDRPSERPTIQPSDRPTPGSPAAVSRGCICPRLDNNRGEYPPWPPDGWWIRPECPVHGGTK